MVSLRGHQILCGWYLQIRRTLSEYLFGVSNGQPEGPSNMDGTVGLGQHYLNIYQAKAIVSLTGHQILSVRYC